MDYDADTIFRRDLEPRAFEHEPSHIYVDTLKLTALQAFKNMGRTAHAVGYFSASNLKHCPPCCSLGLIAGERGVKHAPFPRG